MAILSRRRPLIFSLHRGNIGRYIDKEAISPEMYDIIIRPPGILNSILNRKERISKVPSGALLGPFYPQVGDYSSIPREGIMVIMAAEGGDKWLADQVDFQIDKNFKDIRKQLSQHRIGELARGERIKTLEKGARGELKAIKEASDVMEKGRKFSDERFWEKR